VAAEHLPVLLHGALHRVAVDEEDLLLLGFGLFYLAGSIDVLGGHGGAVGIVLAYLFELLLVADDLAHELRNCRQRRNGRLLRLLRGGFRRP